MVKSLILNLNIHQPFRLREFQVFDINTQAPIFNYNLNKESIEKISQTSYIPTNKYIKNLLEHNKDFSLTLFFSGTVLEQLEEFYPEVLKSFQKLVQNHNVELLGGTYYHSFSSFYSLEEFQDQVEMHKIKLKRIFGKEPTTFKNSEYLFNDETLPIIRELGFNSLILDHTSCNISQRDLNTLGKYNGITIFRKNEKLSSLLHSNWNSSSALSANEISQIIANENGDLLTLSIPYELFGNRYNEVTGIFEFLAQFPNECSKKNISTITPNQALNIHISSLTTISSQSSSLHLLKENWFGNNLQLKALTKLYSLEKSIKELEDRELLENWRKLQSSDHIYYMALKHLKSPHTYSHFESPYEAFIYYMNALQHLEQQTYSKKSSLINA